MTTPPGDGSVASVVDILQRSPGAGAFAGLTRRLSDASVRRRCEAHRDIDWEAPDLGVDPGDPRWQLAPWEPLARSAWYRDQPLESRVAIGLGRQVQALRTAIEFEAVLSQGLLRFAAELPPRHPAFRYAYHEVAEEAQHSLMFQEVIERSGRAPSPSPPEVRALFARVADFGLEAPVLFFLAVLSGEEAFDQLQRRLLASRSTHPLIATVSRVHVTEEARHVSFARALLRAVVPHLDPRTVRHLRYQVPFVVEWTAGHMFGFSPSTLSAEGVPADVAESVAASPEARDVRQRGMSRVLALCHELGIAHRRGGAGPPAD